jgi:hypothetical protein
MNLKLRSYLLKEYGSWSVLVISFCIGVGVSRAFSWSLLPLFLALALLINAKQAYTMWGRKTDGSRSLAVFLVHLIAAGAILLAVFRSDIVMLLPLLLFPAAYLISSKFAGEHARVTEVLGFVLLSLAAVLAKYLLTGGLDVRLFLGVMFYFTAGVFKVKTLLLRKMKDRIAIVVHALLALYVFHRMYIPYIILLPLVDNLLVALYPYRVKLKTTGWIEVAKSLTAFALFINYY